MLSDDFSEQRASLASDDGYNGDSAARTARGFRRWRIGGYVLLFVLLLTVAGFFFARHWLRSAITSSLPQTDGSLIVAGLSAPVSVRRDAHGVPHISASSLDDLVFAQGFVTAQDRLFQMDTLRRHAAGELAAILGAALIPHDKLQRTLQIRASADGALERLPADQLHLLEVYANGVNASIAAQSDHLPIQFKLLRYKPAAWIPRDSILVSLAMFQELTDNHASKLAREKLTSLLPADLVQDLYPVGSWRDHPSAAAMPDLTIPGPPIEEVPLDESQAKLSLPETPHEADALSSLLPTVPWGFSAGSNNWVISGARTASGKPLLANDMHLTATLPGIWYESDLTAPLPGGEPLHVAGVTIPGLPLIVVGHNQHVAWGFTNLGADVQDLYLENITQGADGNSQFLDADGVAHPVLNLIEIIKVKGQPDITLNLVATRHGDAITPIITPVLKGEMRAISLRWTMYDPAVIEIPVLEIARAHDWASFLEAFSHFGGPSQNVVYADDAGHIGYHAIGRIPIRGGANHSASTSVPADIATPLEKRSPTITPDIGRNDDPLASTAIQAPAAPHAAALGGSPPETPVAPAPNREWTGYIPFDQLPQVFDPPGGVIATANARVSTDDYPYPLTLNWGAPYRNERIWHLLSGRSGWRAADMLTIQTDIYSDFDHVLAQRLAYALDHSGALTNNAYSSSRTKTLRQAADLLRSFDGRVSADSPAAAIVASTHALLWPILLQPHLGAGDDPQQLYTWYSKDYALEQIVMHTPPRWLPKEYADWEDFLTAAVSRALDEGNAPSDVSRWRYGSFHTFDVEDALFAQSRVLRVLLGSVTGTGALQQSGDATTVKQVGHSFGPSERFTADFSDLDHSTLNVVLGQSGNVYSPWYLDQFPAWYHGTTYSFPFSEGAVEQSAQHTLTLRPR